MRNESQTQVDPGHSEGMKQTSLQDRISAEQDLQAVHEMQLREQDKELERLSALADIQAARRQRQIVEVCAR